MLNVKNLPHSFLFVADFFRFFVELVRLYSCCQVLLFDLVGFVVLTKRVGEDIAISPSSVCQAGG